MLRDAAPTSFSISTFLYFVHWSSTVFSESLYSPGQMAQLFGVLSYTPKCCGFNPQLGHMQEATNQCFSINVSLSLSPFLSQKINRNISSGEDLKTHHKKDL